MCTLICLKLTCYRKMRDKIIFDQNLVTGQRKKWSNKNKYVDNYNKSI